MSEGVEALERVEDSIHLPIEFRSSVRARGRVNVLCGGEATRMMLGGRNRILHVSLEFHRFPPGFGMNHCAYQQIINEC